MNVFKQAGKTSKDIAREAARKMAREPFEILKSATTQESGVERSSSGSVIDQIITGDGKIPEISTAEEMKMNNEAKQKIEELENELQRLRQQRDQKSAQWNEEQNTKLGHGPEEDQKPKAPLIEPTTARKRGQGSPTKKKQGTREMGKQVSG